MQRNRYSKEHLSAGKTLSCICRQHTFNTKDILLKDAREATALLFWYWSLVFHPSTRKGNTYLRIFRGTYGIWYLIISLLRMESLHEWLIQEWWGQIIHWCQLFFLYLPGWYFPEQSISWDSSVYLVSSSSCIREALKIKDSAKLYKCIGRLVSLSLFSLTSFIAKHRSIFNKIFNLNFFITQIKITFSASCIFITFCSLQSHINTMKRNLATRSTENKICHWVIMQIDKNRPGFLRCLTSWFFWLANTENQKLRD